MGQEDLLSTYLNLGIELVPVKIIDDSYVTPTNFRTQRPKVDWTAISCRGTKYDTYGCFQNNYYIIDVDVKNSKNGWNTLEKSLLYALNVAPHHAVITKSGGVHLYYKMLEPSVDVDIIKEEIKGEYLRNKNSRFTSNGLDYKPNGWVRGPEKLADSSYETGKFTYPSFRDFINNYPDTPSYDLVNLNYNSPLLTANEFLFLLFCTNDEGYNLDVGNRDNTTFIIASKLASWINPKLSDNEATHIISLLQGAMPVPLLLDDCLKKYKRAVKQLATAETMKTTPVEQMPKLTAKTNDDDEDDDTTALIKHIAANGRQKRIPSTTNDIITFLETLYKNRIRFNELFASIEINENEAWEIQNDDQVTRIIRHLETIGFANIPKDKMYMCISEIASRNVFNPLKLYLHNLEWDGKRRLDTLFTKYTKLYHESNPKYAKFVARSFMLSLVARALEPGCKVDTVLVIEGEQGVGKSTFLKIIGGDWYTDSLGTIGTEDVHYNMRKFWLIEMPELSNMKRSDIETVKAFLSRTEDTYRPKYARCAITYPRMCIFAGTTNESQYLVDTTGNRRFMPIRIMSVDQKALLRDREQIIAEAVSRFNAGEKWYFIDKEWIELSTQEQKLRLVRDEIMENMVEEYINFDVQSSSIGRLVGKKRDEPLEWMQIEDMLEIYRGMLTGNPYVVQRKAAAYLKEIGWERKKKRIDGVLKWAYINTNATNS